MKYRDLWLSSTLMLALLPACRGGSASEDPTMLMGDDSSQGGSSGSAGANSGNGGSGTAGAMGGAGNGGGAGSMAGSGGSSGGTSGSAGSTMPTAGTAGASPRNDAGAADSRPASNDGAVPGVCNALFCEDFEASPTLNTKVWTARTNTGNTVAIDTMAAHGTRAAHFHANANGEMTMIFAKIPGALVKKLWGRAYFFVTPEPPEGHTAFFTAGTLNGFPFADKHLEISGYNNSWQLGFWGDGEIISAGGMIPLKRWACLEWEFDDTTGLIRVHVDGKVSFGFSAGANHVGGLTDMGFGFRSWHPAPNPIDLYIDDIAVDSVRIGCFN